MNKLILAAGLFALAPLLSQPADAAGRGARGELVYQVVKKWGPYVQEAYRADIGTWAQQMGPTFAKAPLSALQSAADASNFDAMTDALLGAPAASKAGADISPNSLGDAATDLVFVPISPCRLFDTRLAGGAIAANTVRSFDVTAVSDYSFQGGAASNCNGVGAAGSFAAAVINFTTVTPAAAGYITAFPFGTTQPLAATVNYAGGDIRGNLATVALDQGASANELSVYTFAQTHLVGDIVGYFINPAATALNCVDTADTTVNVAAGATANAVAPACAAGYTQTATNCESSTWQMPFVFFSGGTCSAQNNSAGTASLRASRTCCRVPGR
ncbi:MULTISPECIES: hypothetical protein [unclassified Lysobacter]|uniref:hypothetical protein n=1 Tax=unclassified Lysobacter TaxID=2635362 RepID=UPI0006FFAF1E|nr:MULTISPECIES: hypothetical protein [unclassified Lysobacter]KQZ59934.1 hypothetical protein ASD53_01790 [Lysobacter sp. Root559]KRC38382.1 hypothetical protein ASE10_02135 [Lysobacter sp. Root76]KRD71498.1 hypothetical protein ASE45_06740 [Lysobacter sp. Root96]